MLVRRGVEDHRGNLGSNQLVHRLAIGDIGQLHVELATPLAVARAGLKLALEQVERALGAVDQDESAGPEGEDLASELRADRAGGAGDEHHLISHDFGDPSKVFGDDRSPEQVFDPHTTHPVGIDAPIEEVGQGRNRPDFEAEPERRVHDGADCGPRGAGHRDQEHPCAGQVNHPGELVAAAEHPQAGHDVAGE